MKIKDLTTPTSRQSVPSGTSQREPAPGGAPPVPQVEPPKRKKKSADEIKYWTDDECDRFMAAVKRGGDAMHLALFEVARHRGLRASEIGRLNVADLRDDCRRLQFERLKGSNGGQYFLTERERQALKVWLRARRKLLAGDPIGAIFFSRLKRPISRRRLDELVKHYGRLSGLPEDKRHMHALKHTCATQLMSMEEISIEEVQDHLGHKDLRSTQIYAKITNPRRQKLGRRLRDRW